MQAATNIAKPMTTTRIRWLRLLGRPTRSLVQIEFMVFSRYETAAKGDGNINLLTRRSGWRPMKTLHAIGVELSSTVRGNQRNPIVANNDRMSGGRSLASIGTAYGLRVIPYSKHLDVVEPSCKEGIGVTILKIRIFCAAMPISGSFGLTGHAVRGTCGP